MAALISYSMVESVESPKFIYLGSGFSDHLDQRITDPFFQTSGPWQMSSIKNDGFISYIKFFLSLTLLHYNIKLSQILMQILMTNLGIRIFIISLSSAVQTSVKLLIFHHN